jgi:hypothetical protein
MNFGFGRPFKNREEVDKFMDESPKLDSDAWYRRMGDLTPRTILHQPEGSEEEPQPQAKPLQKQEPKQNAEEETPPDD